MTLLKCDDTIKKPTVIGYYFGIFWKIICGTTLKQSFIAAASLVQDLWQGAYCPLLWEFNVKKAHTGYG